MIHRWKRDERSPKVERYFLWVDPEEQGDPEFPVAEITGFGDGTYTAMIFQDAGQHSSLQEAQAIVERLLRKDGIIL